MLKKLGLFSLAICISTLAFAYETSTVFKTDHFAINQIILDEHEKLDSELEYLITRDIQTKNRLDKNYQSTTAIFPAGSKGLTGTINTQVLGILTVANYDNKEDLISFYTKPDYTTKVGLYISHDLLTQIVDNKVLNKLIPELAKLPLVITDIPVSIFSVDYNYKNHITSKTKAVLFDINIVDSIYYKAQDMAKLNDKCKVDVLAFIDRYIQGIPLFIAAHGALNKIECK